MAKEKTMAEIYNEMTPEQQLCVAYYVNEAINEVEKQKLPSALKESK
jgi:hypothetical protein